MTLTIHESRAHVVLAGSLRQGECFRHEGVIFQTADEGIGVHAGECAPLRPVNQLSNDGRSVIHATTEVERVHLDVTVCRPRDE